MHKRDMADAKAADPERWWSKDTIAVVTGSNKGIGFEIVRQLASAGLTVVLTSRDEKRGEEAVRTMKEKHGLDDIVFHQLDVTNPKSIDTFASWLTQRFGGLDILVNNAGLLNSDLSDKVKAAQEVVNTNYYGVRNLTRALLSLFKPSAAGSRVVNVSSMAGMLICVRNEMFKEQLRDVDNLTEEVINSFVEAHIKDRAQGTNTVLTIPSQELLDTYGNYIVSKVACNAYTRALAREIAYRREGEKIYVNCMCPGVTNTKMSDSRGHSVSEGAETAVWLALLPPSECESGKFFMKKQVRSFDYVQELVSENDRVLNTPSNNNTG